MEIAVCGGRRQSSWWCLLALGVTLVASCGGSERAGPPSDEAGAAGSAETGAGGSADAVLDPYLGARCETDEECGQTGLFCLGPEQDFLEGAGSPAGGLCTQSCATDPDCRHLDASAVCATLAEVPLTLAFATKVVPRICLLGCSLGSPGGSKCHGRGELACRPFASHGVEQCTEEGEYCPGGGLCFRDRCRGLACGPRCNDDSDCAGGRTCDAISGLCSEDLPGSVPIGKACSADIPALSDCGAGICFATFVDGIKYKELCTQSCTVGQPCGGGQGACTMRSRLKDFAVGDIAYCQELCGSDEDCSYPGDLCRLFEDPAVERRYGGLGVCKLPDEP